MKKNECVTKLLISVLSLSVVYSVAKNKVFNKKIEALNESFEMTNALLDKFDEEKDDIESNISKKRFNKKERKEDIYISEDSNLYDELKYQVKDELENNELKIKFFNDEILKNLSDDDLVAFKDFAVEDSAFSYAHDLLVERDYDEELYKYLDDIEFRDFCLSEEVLGNVDNLEEQTKPLYDLECEKHCTNVLTELSHLGDVGFLVNPGDGGSSNKSTSNDEITIEHPTMERKIPFEPSETRTVDQLALLLPFAAVCAVVGSVGLIETAGCVVTVPVYGPIASAALTAVAIVMLAIFAYHLIPVIDYLIGFFLNMLVGLIEFITKFFVSFSTYVTKNLLSLTIESSAALLSAIGMSNKTANAKLAKSFVLNGKRVAANLITNKPIVPLGIMDDYITVANDLGLIHYEYDGNYEEDVEKYGYDWVWAPNYLFIKYMVTKGALFELCSRPSTYYDIYTQTIMPGQMRGYSRELETINKEFGYYWYETPAILDPLYLQHSIAVN